DIDDGLAGIQSDGSPRSRQAEVADDRRLRWRGRRRTRRLAAGCKQHQRGPGPPDDSSSSGHAFGTTRSRKSSPTAKKAYPRLERFDVFQKPAPIEFAQVDGHRDAALAAIATRASVGSRPFRRDALRVELRFTRLA